MDYNIDWIIPALRKPAIPRFLWRICSSITVTAVGCLSKLFISKYSSIFRKSDDDLAITSISETGFLNKPKIYNTAPLHHALHRRPLSVPLITVSNHHSCFDDPGIWGKCIPVVRGNGVFQVKFPNFNPVCNPHSKLMLIPSQEAVDYCIEILARGEWLHVFPEGKVNMTKEFLRLKWGIGRIIYECPVIPIIIPIWHIGMEEVLPNYPPYYLRTGKKVTINVGDPIDLKEIVLKLKEDKASDEYARKVITDRIQNELYRLKEATEELHKNNTS